MKRSMLVCLLAALWCVPFAARAECPITDRPMRVGVPAASPFVIHEGDEWSGFDVELWRLVSARMGCGETEFIPITFQDRVPALSEHRVDAVMGGMTITAEREAVVDFSHGYFSAGQAVMMKDTGEFDLLAFGQYATGTLWRLMAGLIVFCAIWASVVWTAERVFGRNNHLDDDASNDVLFSKNPLSGLFQSFYFVNTTITTVGYGDFTPRTVLGRLLTLWMMWSGIAYAGLCLSALGVVAFSYVNQSHAPSAAELRGVDVAVVAGTTGEDAARALGSKLSVAPDLHAAIELLNNDQVKAVVFDEPDLRHYALGNPEQALAVGDRFTQETYGIALADGRGYRETVNQAILRTVTSPEYALLRANYFGSDG